MLSSPPPPYPPSAPPPALSPCTAMPPDCRQKCRQLANHLSYLACTHKSSTEIFIAGLVFSRCLQFHLRATSSRAHYLDSLVCVRLGRGKSITKSCRLNPLSEGLGESQQQQPLHRLRSLSHRRINPSCGVPAGNDLRLAMHAV